MASLVEATAPSDVPQFPKDLEATNDIVSGTITILIDDLKEGGNETNVH